MIDYNKSLYHFKKNQQLKIIAFKTRDYAIGKSYSFMIEVLSTSNLNMNNLINVREVFIVNHQQFFHGIISAIEFNRYEQNYGYCYRIILSSPLFPLTLTQQNRVYVRRTPIDVIKEILKPYQLLKIDFQIKHNFQPQKAITQYRETDFDFFHRIISEYGLLYYFENNETNYILIITDHLVNNTVQQFNFALDSDNALDERSIYAVCKTQRYLSQYMIVRDYNEEKADRLLQHQNQSDCSVAGNGFHYYCIDECRNHQETVQKSLIYKRAVDLNKIQIKAKTVNKEIRLNDLIKFKSENDIYRVIGLCLSGDEQAAWLNGNKINSRFSSELILIPASIQYALMPVRKSCYLGCMEAEVIGDSDLFANIDEFGRYRVHYHFQNNLLSLSQRLYAVQAISGYRIGMHFPYYSGTTACVIYRNGDIDRPVILGIIPKLKNTSPVTADNYTQHVIRSFLGHEMIFDDKESNQSIRLNSSTHDQFLWFENYIDDSYIQLVNQKGKIIFSANKKLQHFVEQDYSISVKENSRVYIRQHYFVSTQQGDIALHSGRLFLLTSEESSIEFKGESIEFICSDIFNGYSNDEVEIECDNLIGETKPLNLFARQMININANQIELTTGASQLIIQGDTAILSGNTIQLIGDV